MIAIINCGAGNLNSVKNALDYLEEECIITDNPEDIESADRIIFPGVGAFGAVIKGLREKNLEQPLKNAINNGKPFLGICVGLQALFEESEESPGVKGLCIFKGKVKKFTDGKVPQIGWNKVKPANNSVFTQGFAYFVNSYYVVPYDNSIVASITDYYGEFVSAIKKDNITATQFHPEKSGEYGLDLLKRWLAC